MLQTTFPSPWGPLLADSDGEALTRLWFVDELRPEPVTLPLFALLQEELAAYAGGRLRTFTIPLKPAGTPFQRAVWDELVRIPWGATVSYSDVARAVGRLDTIRAVGGAIGRNPIAILIPCHRVVGSDGGLTGYAGGLNRKEALLRLEGWGATAQQSLFGGRRVEP